MTTFFGKKVKQAQAKIIKKLPKLHSLETVEQIDDVLKQLLADENGKKAHIFRSEYVDALLDKRFSLTNPPVPVE